MMPHHPASPRTQGAAAEEPSETISPRWRRLPEERPRQILDAAFEVFAEYGLGSARLDEIARRAGVSKGTIYLYFDSKEELFRAVVEAKVVAVIEAAEFEVERSASTSLSAREELRLYLTRNWEYLRSSTYVAMYRLVQTELPHFPDLMRFYGEHVIERSMRLTASVITRGIARGEFAPTDALAAARLVSSMLMTNALWFERRHLYNSSMSDSAEQVRDAVIDFSLRGLSIPGPLLPTSPLSHA